MSKSLQHLVYCDWSRQMHAVWRRFAESYMRAPHMMVLSNRQLATEEGKKLSQRFVRMIPQYMRASKKGTKEYDQENRYAIHIKTTLRLLNCLGLHSPSYANLRVLCHLSASKHTVPQCRWAYVRCTFPLLRSYSHLVDWTEACDLSLHFVLLVRYS